MSQPFSIQLQRSPQLVQSGVSTHGLAGKPIIERYRLPTLWCLHLYDYDALMEIEDERWEIKPGSVSLTPPDKRLVYHYDGSCRHTYTHFRLASSAKNAELSDSPVARHWYEPNEISAAFRHAMQTIVEVHAQGKRGGLLQTRAEVALWELLWQLTELTPQNTPESLLHPCLQRAMALIETRIGDSINVAALAHEVGISHNQLTRLFLAYTQQTVVAYIRSQRAKRASHLLVNSTLPIKTIAAQVGTPDLGQFNHLMRRETGLSPRALRVADSTSKSL